MDGFHVRREGRVVTLVLNGHRRNALDDRRYTAIARTADSVEPGQVLVLRAEGPHFCAGQDLDQHRTAAEQGRAQEALRQGAGAVLSVVRCRGLVVVAAQGAAVGAGALLVAAGDVVVLADDAELVLPELRLGMPLGASVAELLLPSPLVRRMMITGERVSATRVAAIGAARVVARDALEGTTGDVVSDVVHLSRRALVEARRMWGADARERAARSYEREVDATAALMADEPPPRSH
jgi:enoyl-CoA hydratase/carnithine racemase